MTYRPDLSMTCMEFGDDRSKPLKLPQIFTKTPSPPDEKKGTGLDDSAARFQRRSLLDSSLSSRKPTSPQAAHDNASTVSPTSTGAPKPRFVTSPAVTSDSGPPQVVRVLEPKPYSPAGPIELSVEAPQIVHDYERCDGTRGPLMTVRVRWRYRVEQDPENDLRRWDFITLHRQGAALGEYESSRYLMSQLSGVIELVAPPEGGMFEVSVVRDNSTVFSAMRHDPERQACFKHKIRLDQPETLVQLAVVPVISPEWSVDAAGRNVTPGATGQDEALRSHAEAPGGVSQSEREAARDSNCMDLQRSTATARVPVVSGICS